VEKKEIDMIAMVWMVPFACWSLDNSSNNCDVDEEEDKDNDDDKN
jgi:hypothetical protein